MELTLDEAVQKAVEGHIEGRLVEAERLYRAILEFQPLHPDANHNLGVLAVSVNKADAALPLFKTALEANPKIEQFWLSYIDALIKEKQFGNAKRVVEQARKQGVKGEKISVLDVNLASLNQTENIDNVSPSQEQLNNLLEHYQSGRFDEAEKLAMFLTQEFSTNQFGWKVLGALLKKTDRISESLVASQKSVECAPLDAEAHNNLGITLKSLGRLDEAEVSCKQAVALKPNYAEGHNNLGIVLKELGRLEEAEASNRQAIVLKPNYAEAHNNLGNTLQELGRLEEAEASYLQAIAFKSDSAEMHSNLGNTLKQQGRLGEAEISYRQVIALEPHHFAKAYDELGVILQSKGKFEDAEVCYKKYEALEPNKLSTTASRGAILFNQGEFEHALRAFDSYDNITSRACALESLYCLGRIESIYERIVTQSDLDSENIRIAAIAAFLAEREGKDTAHNFCNNPIDFIYFSNISSHIKGSNLFITEVIDELRNVKTSWEPISKATQNGFQASIDIFKNPLEKMSIIKSIVTDELNSYYSKFKNESCSYITKWPSKKIVSGWHVILKQQGHQKAHIHPSGWLSGVIYLKVVPSLGKHEGAIEFSLDSPNYPDSGSSRKIHQPKLGDIVFFPSSLHHRTVPFSTSMDRICISFDLLPDTEV